MRRSVVRIVAVSAVGAALVGSAGPMSGAPSVGALASSSGYAVQIITNNVDCYTGTARFRAKGTLSFVPNNAKGKLYFDKTIKFKRMIGTDRYLELDRRSYDSPRFTAGDLPTYTTLADKTSQTDFDRVYVFFDTVLRQERRGPDKKLWKDERRLRVPNPCGVSVSGF